MGCLSLTYQEPKNSLRIIYKNESPRLLEENPSFFQSVLEKKVCAEKKGANSYRYGFQGQEQDNEIKGQGNSVNYKYRMYDPRIGKFFATDPFEYKYSSYSPYHFSSNQPIHTYELEGRESRLDLNSHIYNNPYLTYEEADEIYNAMSPSLDLSSAGETLSNIWNYLYDNYLCDQCMEGGHDPGLGGGWGGNKQASIENTAKVAVIMLTAGFAIEAYAGGTLTTFVLEEAVSEVTGLPFSLRDIGDFVTGLGRTYMKITKGLNDKTIVIGQGMDDVIKVADEIGAEVFEPSPAALKEWDDLVKDAGGAHLTDDVVKETKLFNENKEWIKTKKEEGYNILDIGENSSGNKSTFYEMEKETVYD